MRHAVINVTTGIVENVAEIVDGDGSAPETGFIFVASETAGAGDTWDGTQIIAAPSLLETPRRPQTAFVDPEKEQFKADIAALTARLAALEAK
jgi:hypothetical protein